MGDWHMLALTADGRVLAWGNDMQGSLGVDDSMRRGDTPVEVQFPGPTRVFCIGITAMGWHSGALGPVHVLRLVWSCKAYGSGV
jgi:alpha-tubulin suppressor-like RCC1 family protein